MAKKRILVLTDTMPWGHRSIARAIFGYLKSKEKEEGIEVSYAEVKLQFDTLNVIYMAIYRFVPQAGFLAQKAMENKQARKMFLDLLDYDLPDLVKTMKKFKPDLVISSYFMHSHSLVKWRDQTGEKFKLWTIAADPWTVNPISFVPGADLNLVYDEKTMKLANTLGIRDDKIFKTGWWTRSEMYQKYDRNKSREKLGFRDDRPVVFVGGGSLGTNAVSKLLPVLMMVKKPVGIVFNTGTDKLTYSMVEEYVKLFKRLRKGDLVQIKNLGWIDNMAEVLSACDIVFGKAGPNFLFDVMAQEKPFVAISHVAGQEDGNVDLILEKKLGWVKEKTGDAASFLLDYLKNPNKYNNKYKENIIAEAKRNKETLPKILERIKEG